MSRRWPLGLALAAVLACAAKCPPPAAAPAASGGKPAVYFVNSAGPAWPVRAAAAEWAAVATKVAVRYGPCPRPKPADVKCRLVREGTGLSDTNIGATTLLTHNVRFNPDYAGLPYPQRLAATCHELGHALGVEHNDAADSCMNPEIGQGTSTRPGKRDVARLNGPGS